MGTGLVLYADVAADSSNAGFAMCASPHRHSLRALRSLSGLRGLSHEGCT